MPETKPPRIKVTMPAKSSWSHRVEKRSEWQMKVWYKHDRVKVPTGTREECKNGSVHRRGRGITPRHQPVREEQADQKGQGGNQMRVDVEALVVHIRPA
jgi:hypothetical protein